MSPAPVQANRDLVWRDLDSTASELADTQQKAENLDGAICRLEKDKVELANRCETAEVCKMSHVDCS